MTPEQALQNLDEAAAVYVGNRKQHDLLARSRDLLAETLREWHELKAAEPDGD